MTDHDRSTGMEPARREFLKKSGATVAGVGVLSTGPCLRRGARAGRRRRCSRSGEARTLLRMTRDIYPHDSLPDSSMRRSSKCLGRRPAGPGQASLFSTA